MFQHLQDTICICYSLSLLFMITKWLPHSRHLYISTFKLIHWKFALGKRTGASMVVHTHNPSTWGG
jgi:hypothetical protein